MIINNVLNEMRVVESTSDFLKIQQNIVDMFKHNNDLNIIRKLAANYIDFMKLVKGQDKEETQEPEKKDVKKSKEEIEVPDETATGKVMKSVKKEEPKKAKEKEDKRPNLEAAVATLLKRTTGEDIELDLDRYYTTSGRKQSDILTDPVLRKTIKDIKATSLSDEKRLLMPLFQVNIKLDEYLSNKRHMLSIPEKQKIVLAVFWILLIDGKYVPSGEKLDALIKRYGQSKSFKTVTAKGKALKAKEEKDKKEKEVE